MDPALTSASTVSVIGIGTVFVALLTLVGVVSATGRLIERGRARAASGVGAASEAVAGSQPAADGAPLASDLRPLALAAYALHLRRRAGVAAGGRPGLSRWAMAGRLRQTTPLLR